jgi:hypothetical protein
MLVAATTDAVNAAAILPELVNPLIEALNVVPGNEDDG